jgi:heavy metal translocating P-type ATPase
LSAESPSQGRAVTAVAPARGSILRGASARTPREAPPRPERRPPALTRYPLVLLTAVVGIIGLTLQAISQPVIAQTLVSGYAIAVAAVQGWHMVRRLAAGHVGIDLLAIVAIVSTVLVGEYWASLIIVLMLAGGQALEDFAGARARRELTSLLQNAPRQAHRVDEAGGLTDVSVEDVRVADVLRVRPGEVVPVDGVLVSDVATLDESRLTGESLPAERRAGDSLLSGTVNQDESILIRASATAEDSQYQRIVQLVSDASESQPPMVRLADRYAVPFTVAALALAGAAWLLSGDPVRFAEVLVVATPCPLLLAAPIAFVGGISRAARGGIIVKSGATLEQLSRLKTVAFDKTGTLTHGAPEVSEIHPAPDVDRKDLVMMVASVEQYSGHVLASSLTAAAAREGVAPMPATNVSEETAGGVTGTVGGHTVTVGKRSFIAALGVKLGPSRRKAGQMAVYAAIDGVYAGEILLADRVREEARRVLDALRRCGVRRTVMLTGDLQPTAQHVADELGITDVRAECLPEDKVEAVRDQPDRPVMMVGDGVNDAPVLAAAEIGVAMGAKGSTAATESADVVIMVDELSRVPHAVRIGRETTRIALEAIWIGISLSAGLMVVAALGALPALLGATLQEAVDLITILYALRALAGSRSSVP